MKICFWGNIASALSGDTKGGGELQIALIAKALAMAGHEVVVIDPHIIKDCMTKDGIKLISLPKWNKGLKGIRLFLYRIPALRKKLIEQKADFYYVRMRSYLHITSFWAAKKVKAKFILAFASDTDILSFRDKYLFEYKPNFRLAKYLALYLPNDIIYKYLLRRADFLIMQYSGQDTGMYRSNAKRILFPNIIDQSEFPQISKSTRNYYVYVGSLSILKGSDKLFQLLSIIDKSNEIIVVGQPNDEKSVIVFEHLKTLKNVILKGRLKHYDTLKLISNSKGLINTSNFEGFPNVFLEAWTLGVPVLSLNVNPGSIFEKYSLGVCFNGDIDKMKEYIDQNEIVKFDTSNLIEYSKKFHDFQTAAQRFENNFK